jgi:hypothetical protein
VPPVYQRIAGLQGIQPQDDIVPDLGVKHANLQSFFLRISSTSASFKTGMVSSDSICRKYNRLGFISGSSATILDMVMVTGAPVSMVTRLVLSCSSPRRFVYHWPPCFARSVWNVGLSVMTPTFPSTRRFLLVSGVLFDIFNISRW